MQKRIIDEVRKAGFNTDHVFEVPFKPWMIDAIKSKSYKEKGGFCNGNVYGRQF